MVHVRKSRQRSDYGHLSSGQVSTIRASFRPLVIGSPSWADQVKHWSTHFELPRTLVEEIAASSRGQA